MSFTVYIEKRALKDIQNIIDFYDEQLVGLGNKFYSALSKHIDIITKNPHFEIRYKDYRALPIKKFPFIIVFYINQTTNTIFISAVFHTKQSTTKLPK